MKWCCVGRWWTQNGEYYNSLSFPLKCQPSLNSSALVYAVCSQFSLAMKSTRPLCFYLHSKQCHRMLNGDYDCGRTLGIKATAAIFCLVALLSRTAPDFVYFLFTSDLYLCRIIYHWIFEMEQPRRQKIWIRFGNMECVHVFGTWRSFCFSVVLPFISIYWDTLDRDLSIWKL